MVLERRGRQVTPGTADLTASIRTADASGPDPVSNLTGSDDARRGNANGGVSAAL